MENQKLNPRTKKLVKEKIRNASVITALYLGFLCHCFSQQSPQELFNQANQAYNDGKFDDAIGMYENLHTSNDYSSELYLNLGNAYFQKKKYAQSILNYERGLKISPNNNSLLSNLELASNQLESEIIEVPPFVLIRWWRSFCNIFTTNLWAIIQILLLIGIAFLVSSIFLGRIKPNRQQSIKGLYVLIPLFILSSLALMSRYKISVTQNTAIVMQAVKLMEGPDDRSGALNELYPGNKVTILDDIEKWYKVRLANQMIGWIPDDSVEKI